MSIFSGHTLQDLRDLWKAQPLATYTGPLCVTYTGQPPFEPDPLEPEPVIPAMTSWQCRGCGTIYNMTVQSCGCQVHRWTRTSDKFELDRGT